MKVFRTTVKSDDKVSLIVTSLDSNKEMAVNFVKSYSKMIGMEITEKHKIDCHEIENSKPTIISLLIP